MSFTPSVDAATAAVAAEPAGAAARSLAETRRRKRPKPERSPWK
jgi:hypothetical protein